MGRCHYRVSVLSSSYVLGPGWGPPRARSRRASLPLCSVVLLACFASDSPPVPDIAFWFWLTSPRCHAHRLPHRQPGSTKTPHLDSTLSLIARATLGHRGRTPACASHLAPSLWSIIPSFHQSIARPRTRVLLSALHTPHTQHTFPAATKWRADPTRSFAKPHLCHSPEQTGRFYRLLFRLSYHCHVFICIIPQDDPPQPCRLAPARAV